MNYKNFYNDLKTNVWIMKMTDTSRMPFGKYKNEKMANVPAEYLLWLYNEGKCFGDLKDYIAENLEVLKDEIKSK